MFFHVGREHTLATIHKKFGYQPVTNWYEKFFVIVYIAKKPE